MWVFLVFSAVCLVLGWGAYAGWNRRWLSHPLIYSGHLGPALVPIGAGLLLMGLTDPVAGAFTQDGPTTASGLAWLLCFVGGLALVVTGHVFGTSGMPASWRPAWVRVLEGLAPRHGDPAPSPRELAPSWSTLAGQAPGAAESEGPYSPQTGPLPQRSVQALLSAGWGGAGPLLRDPDRLATLQGLGLLDDRLHPTAAGALLMARHYRTDVETVVVEAHPPGHRSVVVTVVARETAILEFRQDWGTGPDAIGPVDGEPGGTGGFDVVPFHSEERLEELLRPWVTEL